MPEYPCRARTSDSALWDDSVARTVSVGQHLSTSYRVVTVTLVIDAIQECGVHSADYAEMLGWSFTCQTVQKTVEVPTESIPLLMCLQIPRSLSALARVMFER